MHLASAVPHVSRFVRATSFAVVLAAALAAGGAAHAQTAAAPAPAAASPAKKELVAKVLQLQTPGIEAMARALVEQPALQLAQRATIFVRQRVPEDKREALGRDLQTDLKKYVDETTPIVRDRAVKLAPSTIGTILEEKMTEDELREVIRILESPVNRKFQSLAGDMQRALTQKLVPEVSPQVQPKLQALEQAFARKLDAAATPPAGAASGPRR